MKEEITLVKTLNKHSGDFDCGKCELKSHENALNCKFKWECKDNYYYSLKKELKQCHPKTLKTGDIVYDEDGKEHEIIATYSHTWYGVNDIRKQHGSHTLYYTVTDHDLEKVLINAKWHKKI